jgi:hypothetical protein
MEVYITKYALTKGILKLDGERSNSCASMLVVRTKVPGRTYDNYYHGEGRDWHRTLEGAKQKAEAMRKKRLVSLENSMEKLKKLKF